MPPNTLSRGVRIYPQNLFQANFFSKSKKALTPKILVPDQKLLVDIGGKRYICLPEHSHPSEFNPVSHNSPKSLSCPNLPPSTI